MKIQSRLGTKLVCFLVASMLVLTLLLSLSVSFILLSLSLFFILYGLLKLFLSLFQSSDGFFIFLFYIGVGFFKSCKCFISCFQFI